MKYDLSKLMKKAWSLFRQAMKKTAITFGAALALAWKWIKAEAANVLKIEAAAEAAGFGDVECHTWAGWQALGRMVIHTSEAAFKVEVTDPTTKKGTRIKSFFSYEQTQPAPMAV
jgi:hypothetical protein